MFERERPLSKFMPWIAPVSDHTTLLACGSLLAVFEVSGVMPGDDETIAYLHDRLNLTWLNVGRDDLILTTLRCRGTATADAFPPGIFRTSFAADLDREYRARLFDHMLYLERTFLCVQVRPPRPAGEFVGSRMDRMRAKRPAANAPQARMDRLDTVCEQIAAHLSRYGVRRLGLYEHNGLVFSEPAEAIAFAVTGTWRRVPVTTGYMGAAMLSETVIFGPESIEIREPGRRQFAAALSMASYPSSYWPGMFGHLNAAPYRYTIMHSFQCMSLQAGQDVLTRKQNRMVHAGDKAHDQLAELDEASNQITARKWVMGEHCFVMCVFADDLPALADVANAAWRDLADAGVVVARETLGNQAAFLSLVPGNHHLRLRPGAISSRAFAAFSPLHAYPTGPAKGYWGGPVALFRTIGGTPYNFHLHVGDLGNVFVTGRAGSGKSTWVSFIMAQAEKAGAQVIVWDKDRGLEIAVRALGGSYLPLRNGVASVAPLRALDGANPDDVAFLRRLLRGCIVGSSSFEIPQEVDRRLGLGIEAVLAMPPDERELADICAFLPHADPNGARARLEAWCWGREKGWIIDGRQHDVDLSAMVVGFDQTAILDNAEARGPIMATLFHLSEKLIDGRRLIFVIDEFWKALQDENFRDLVHDKLKTLRKRNSPVILATQSPRDALNSVIAHTIREQCPTGVHFANPQANAQDYGEAEGIGLTPAEIERVRTLPDNAGMFLLRQGTRSIVAQLPLFGMNRHIAVLSGRESTVRLLDRVRAEVGDNPADWLPVFEGRRTQTAAMENA